MFWRTRYQFFKERCKPMPMVSPKRLKSVWLGSFVDQSIAHHVTRWLLIGLAGLSLVGGSLPGAALGSGSGVPDPPASSPPRLPDARSGSRF